MVDAQGVQQDRPDERADVLGVPGAEVWLAAAVQDLQDPLQAAYKHLKGIEERFLESLPLVARRSVTTALQSIQQAQELVDQTLACATAQDIAPQQVRLGDVMEELRSALSMWFDGGAEMEVRSLPTIHADPGGVRRVLQNLVSNAVKHAGRPVRVTVSASRERNGWWINVADDGPGMPADLCEALSDPDGLHPGKGGVGLALCQRILEAHGGRMDCEVDGGTTVRTFWPDKPGRRSAAARRK